MPTELYLDTARFGRMRLRAQEAGRDFAHLCGAEGGSAVVEDLLRHGFEAWTDSLRRRYPGLAPWRGVAELKRSLRRLVGRPDEVEVLLAARSATLMRLAARAMFARCRSVLHTDLEWPAYADILRDEAEGSGGRVEMVSIEEQIRTDRLDRLEVADLIAASYRRLGCDGLSLSAVGFRGVRFPIDEILDILEGRSSPRFVVIDASQALGHLPWEIGGGDIVVGGAHKWLRSGHPLGLAFAVSLRARDALREVGRTRGAAADCGDPLFDLVRQVEGECMESLGETADLSGLFCTVAAILAETCEPWDLACRFRERLANSVSLEDAARGTGWSACPEGPGLRSGIVLLRSRDEGVSSISPGRLRAEFQRRGVALSTYPGGYVRLSMPYTSWLDDDLEQLARAFRSFS